MRTEQLLHDALSDLADTVRTPETSLPRILAGLPVPASTARRNRRRVLVAALTAVLLVAAVVAPGLVGQQTVAPAGRVPGNWNLTHRVDLPPGWQPGLRSVSATSESSTYADTVGAGGWTCTVDVLAAGRRLPSAVYVSAPDGLPDIHGRPGAYGSPRDGQGERLDWQYAEQSWASVSCDLQSAGVYPGGKYADPRPIELDFARRVVFEPTPVRLPFLLDALPAAYQVRDMQTEPEAGAYGLGLSSSDPGVERPLLTISATRGTTGTTPGLPGQETTAVDGVPAVLSATEGRLCLNDRGYTACVATGGDAVNRTKALWPAGHRELLLEVAHHLRLAKHLDDPSRWPDANEALPR